MPDSVPYFQKPESHLIDSHFHLTDIVGRGLSAEESISSIRAGIDIGTKHADLPERVSLLEKTLSSIPKNDRPEIFISAGMGPWETCGKSSEALKGEFDIFSHLAEKYKPDFIGEFGFDFHWPEYGGKEIQEYLFDLNALFAEKSGKKIIIHSRDAEEATAEAIKKHPALTGVLHCFSGGAMLLRTALDLGYKISYAGNITYKANSALRDTLRFVPRERLLIETDAPYLSPAPKRGRANSSKNIIHTYQCIAEVLSISVEELSERVFENFQDFVE